MSKVKVSNHILEVEKVHGNNVLNLMRDFIIFAPRFELIDKETKERFELEIKNLSVLN
ncbi:MAG: hypothetical protein M3M87_05470 [Thermoproteota archaeon]|nr:hypothetical protein [Thermoproteota archaeon]